MATIPGVSDNELIRTTWGDAVADELNGNTVKKTAAQTMAGPLTVTGAITANNQIVISDAAPTATSHATRKDYVDLKIARTGDLAVSGLLRYTATPAGQVANDDENLTTTGYVNDYAVSANGDRMTGDLYVGAGDGYNTYGVRAGEVGIVFADCGTEDTANMALTRNGPAAAYTTGQAWVYFRRVAAVAGSITINGSGTSYNTTSDHRLKDDLGPLQVDPLGVIEALQPKRLRWKDSGIEFDGFIAHEVQEAAPQAVVGDKDAVYPPDHPMLPGEPDLQQLDNAALVVYLVGAVQTLSARVAALEAA